jgi:hypothetical protein
LGTAGVVDAEEEDDWSLLTHVVTSLGVSARSPAWWGNTMSLACAGVIAGYRARMSTTANAAPTIWAATKLGTEDGAMPAKEFENTRPTVMAGLAKLVELVKKYAAPM